LWIRLVFTGAFFLLSLVISLVVSKRSGVLTDLEFYELRYSGKAAAFLRGLRALYLGVFFNVMIMATVSLAAIKSAKVDGKARPGGLQQVNLFD
jgi:solute:Na+ symporter, SSS family